MMKKYPRASKALAAILVIILGLLVAGWMGKGPMREMLKSEPASKTSDKKDKDKEDKQLDEGDDSGANGDASKEFKLVRKPACAMEATEICNDPARCPCGGECDAEADPETDGCRCMGDCE